MEEENQLVDDNYAVKSENIPLGRLRFNDEPQAEYRGSGQIVGYSSDYEVNIRKLTSGYILRVGCQEIAVESGSDVTKLIGIYLSGDKMVGDKWMTSDKNVQNFIKNNFDITK